MLLILAGYAVSGGGNRIVRVDVTADGGRTWQQADLRKQDSAAEPRHYGWTLWEAEVKVPKGAKEMEVSSWEHNLLESYPSSML